MNIISLIYAIQHVKVYAVTSISSINYIKQISKLTYQRIINKITFNKEISSITYQQLFVGDSYPLESYTDDSILNDYDTVLTGGRINGGYCTSWVAKRIDE